MIEITEVFPNPKGKDDNLEWIELTNYSNSDINLKNHYFEIIYGKKKTSLIQEIANSFTEQPLRQNESRSLQILKALPNSNVKIILKNPQNNIIDTIYYEKSKEDKSLQKIHHHNIYDQIETQLIWNTPSKGLLNPIYNDFIGTITKINYPNLEIINNENLKSFAINNYPQTFFNQFLNPGTEIKISTNTFKDIINITNIKITKSPPIISNHNTDQSNILQIGIPIITIFLIIILLYKIQNRQKRQGSSFSSKNSFPQSKKHKPG